MSDAEIVSPFASPPATHRSRVHPTTIALDSSVRPKGRNVRWIMIGAIALLTVLSFLDRANFSIAAPTIAKELGLSNLQIGTIFSAFAWAYALMSLPSGWLVDRFGPKAVIAGAATLWSLAGALTSLASTTGTFMLLRAALGTAEAPLFPGALKATNAWFPDREKGVAISIYIAAMQIGFAIAPPISTALILNFGWPAMFMIIGAAGFVGVAVWLFIYREPDRHPWLSDTEKAYIAHGQANTRQEAAAQSPLTFRDWLGLFRYGTVWSMVLGAGCLQYVFSFYLSWMPTYLEKVHGMSMHRVGFAAAIPFIAGAFGVLVGGRISDWMVTRGVQPFKARRTLMAAASLMTGGVMFATAFVTTQTAAVAVLSLGLFVFSFCAGPFWVVASDAAHTPRMIASIAAIQNAGGFIGVGLAPIVTGFILDKTGNFFMPIVVTAVIAVVGAVMYGLVLRKRIPL